MTLREIFSRIDRSELNKECGVSSVTEEMGITDVYNYTWGKTLLNSYFFVCWRCTDTPVGYRAYFLGDEPVAISVQKFRKYDEEFRWVSREAYQKTFDYLLTLRETPSADTLEEDDLINLDKEFDETGDGFKLTHGEMFKLEYRGQLYSNEDIFLNGVQVCPLFPESRYIEDDKMVLVKFSDGTQKEVAVADLDIRMNII